MAVIADNSTYLSMEFIQHSFKVTIQRWNRAYSFLLELSAIDQQEGIMSAKKVSCWQHVRKPKVIIWNQEEPILKQYLNSSLQHLFSTAQQDIII